MTVQLENLKVAKKAAMEPLKVSCSNCRVRNLCLPAKLNSEEVKRFDTIVERKTLLQRNEYLFRENDQFDSLYVARTGALKACKPTLDGRVQVTSFVLPGQMLGLDGIGNYAHDSAAIALETSAICRIPYSRLERLSAEIPKLMMNINSSLSRQINQGQQLIILLGKRTAGERVAALLLRLVNHNDDLKLSTSHLRLPMKRLDIANHLGLTIETVSRTFSRMERMNIINVDKREIMILNPQALLHGSTSRKAASPGQYGQGLHID